ncbi:MAG: hypothetical protein V1930_07070 [Pseudomonadota bacterium]
MRDDDLTLIQKAEAIILPQSCSPGLYKACTNSSARIFPDYRIRFKYPGKIGQTALFERLKCPHPVTTIWSSVAQFVGAYTVAKTFPHEIPFLMKGNEGHEGEGIYFIPDRDALNSCLENLLALENKGAPGFISQEFIKNGGNVLRTVIIGSTIITYWKRSEAPGQMITTISQGARIDKSWKTELQKKGREITEKISATTGINLAAFDFIFPPSQPVPQPLILEINYYFGRRGLGGSIQFYHLLYDAIRGWLRENGFDAGSVRLV